MTKPNDKSVNNSLYTIDETVDYLCRITSDDSEACELAKWMRSEADFNKHQLNSIVPKRNQLLAQVYKREAERWFKIEQIIKPK